MTEKYISSETLVRNLSSADRDLVMTSLGILEQRRDAAGQEQARELLLSQDDYIWFNACQYLAALNDEIAVPYLIKGLKHPAWRARDDVVGYLEQITGEEIGKEQEKWIEWWNKMNPYTVFDFEYQSLNKKAEELSSTSHILINRVLDPLRISHMGSQIRLTGIKLKDQADKEKAIRILEIAVLLQMVQLEFDSGDKLDGEGARWALVYWVGNGPEELYKIGRKNLAPVPFKQKILIQEYLLESGLYELHLDDVNDDRIKNLLIKKGVRYFFD